MSVRELKLCLLGDAGVGKSSIATRFVCDRFFPDAESTIGASFMSKTLMVEDKIFKCQIWDTAGQEKYRGLAPMYYRGAAAAIVTYDITDQKSFNMLQEWVTELRTLGPDAIVIAIVGNKSDLDDKREIQRSTGEKYAEKMDAVFIEASAKTGDHVEEIFVEIARRLPALAEAPKKQTFLSDGDLNDDKDKKKGCC